LMNYLKFSVFCFFLPFFFLCKESHSFELFSNPSGKQFTIFEISKQEIEAFIKNITKNKNDPFKAVANIHTGHKSSKKITLNKDGTFEGTLLGELFNNSTKKEHKRTWNTEGPSFIKIKELLIDEEIYQNKTTGSTLKAHKEMNASSFKVALPNGKFFTLAKGQLSISVQIYDRGKKVLGFPNVISDFLMIPSDLKEESEPAVAQVPGNNNGSFGTMGELDAIKKECMMNKEPGSPLEKGNEATKDPTLDVSERTSLNINGKDFPIEIVRWDKEKGNVKIKDDGITSRISLPKRGILDVPLYIAGGKVVDGARAANELGNVLLDAMDGKLDGNCMSPDGRRISKLEAEALSDKISAEWARSNIDPKNHPYPFDKHLPKDPDMQKVFKELCPANLDIASLYEGNLKTTAAEYDKLYQIKMKANDLVKQGKYKEAYDLLKKDKDAAPYACDIPKSAEFFANNPSSGSSK